MLPHQSLRLCTMCRGQLDMFYINKQIQICVCLIMFRFVYIIWLSIVGLLLAITVYIISNINILIALAKGYSHRCCYGQYLSKLFPYYLATILPAYKLRRTTAYLNIMQGYSLSWAWIWTQWLYAMSLWAADCTDFIGYSKLPFWCAFLVC